MVIYTRKTGDIMKFLQAQLSDVNQIIEMRIAYLLTEYPILSDAILEVIRQELPRYINESLGKNLLIYNAKDNEIVVATVFMAIDERPISPNFKTGKVGTILNVYTLPAYRRKGFAEKLLNMAISDAKILNLSHLSLSSTTGGLMLYKKIGFVEVNSELIDMRLKIK